MVGENLGGGGGGQGPACVVHLSTSMTLFAKETQGKSFFTHNLVMSWTSLLIKMEGTVSQGFQKGIGLTLEIIIYGAMKSKAVKIRVNQE